MSGDDLSLRILDVQPGDEIAGARSLRLRTTRGEIPIIVHAPQVQPLEVRPVEVRPREAGTADAPARAVLCVSGALGGFDGPAKLYLRLGQELPALGITVVRLNYRMPNEFGECVLDTMAGLAFLSAMQYRRAAIVGHSFGGAVAINAGTLSPTVTAVVAVSSQLAGAHVVAELAPRPLLLLHGTADTILPHECSERIYERAREPRTLKLFPGVGHRFTEAAEELLETVRGWLLAHL
ncbi:MAG TPA: dienelactone hydrolase family protein [Candidatus Binataceae bacterium]|jgi:pimeloyl-ACP methyl ester carboxylesterase|nr:dienelactone hydrolase family protein [Candidatus Binataceae bacterium]